MNKSATKQHQAQTILNQLEGFVHGLLVELVSLGRRSEGEKELEILLLRR